MTSLIHLGHACFFFESEKAGCLIDPWLSPDGAYNGLWRPLPPNAHCADWVEQKMKQKATAIIVTRAREDRCDIATLKKLLPLSHGFYVPAYADTSLQALIRKNLAISPQAVGENDARLFHDITLRFFIDQPGQNSAAALQDKNLSFLAAGSCRIDGRSGDILKTCGKIDILAAAYTDSDRHPVSAAAAEEVRKIPPKEKLGKFVSTAQLIQSLKAPYYIPAAGPALFMLKEHMDLNQEGVIPRWWEFEDFLREKHANVAFTPLKPGGTALVDDNGVIEFFNVSERLDAAALQEILDHYGLSAV